MAAKDAHREQSSERRFREALYRGIRALTSSIDRQAVALEAAEMRVRREERARLDAESAEWRRRRAERQHEEATDPKLAGDRTMFVATFAAMRLELEHLPPEFYERRMGSARIVCGCRRLLDVRESAFFTCSCSRVFCVSTNAVKTMPAEALRAAA